MNRIVMKERKMSSTEGLWCSRFKSIYLSNFEENETINNQLDRRCEKTYDAQYSRTKRYEARTKLVVKKWKKLFIVLLRNTLL